MSFSTLIFTVCFLPIFLIVNQVVLTRTDSNVRYQNRVLLIFSLIFYLFAGIGGLLVLFLCTLIAWIGGRQIQKTEGSPLMLWTTIGMLVAVLAFFKYAGFFMTVAMPLGLSFYIFKLISYVADVYTGKCDAEDDVRDFLLYVVCFHHVSQGPIVRYGDMKAGMVRRKISTANMAAGIYRFSLGLAKKVILADQMGKVADTLLPMSEDLAKMPTLGIWIGSIFFSLQMYLDFSAYTDMAIGLGQMAGFIYPENFDYPYCADSIKVFWRKWHMTLSFFFRDYVYIPLGGSRKGSARTKVNLLIVWLLTGVWHGATWNFVIWGFYYFVFISLDNALSKREIRMPKVLAHIYVVFVFNLGWLIFRFTDFSQLGTALKGFFGFGEGFSSQVITVTLQNNIFIFIIAILACTPLFRNIRKAFEGVVKSREMSAGLVYGWKTVISLLALILGVIFMAGSGYQPFLYNNF
ncbi:MAG: MBOAT family protein [Eubacterium sp.]|nr:MBOAT family protein [Eubacterium sp.]MBR6172712.1 MBOAT family protein [Eubacterium sp.]